METNSNVKLFREKEVAWDELAAIGIMKEDLASSGGLDALLGGEETSSIPLSLTLIGVSVEMDATLKLIRSGEKAVLEINGVKPSKSKK
ncbi:hypothetical protein FACS189415_5280 [Bacteroidia bacterium]|nr:hypothetical protein FACS189415_5280 [Bacteroidia bacterium]